MILKSKPEEISRVELETIFVPDQRDIQKFIVLKCFELFSLPCTEILIIQLFILYHGAITYISLVDTTIDRSLLPRKQLPI